VNEAVKIADALQLSTETCFAGRPGFDFSELATFGFEEGLPNANNPQKNAVIVIARPSDRLIFNHEVITFIERRSFPQSRLLR